MSHVAEVSPSVAARIKAAAESLVVRSRAGDQNAIAMIMRIRESVPRSRRAALAYEALREYVRRNPVSETRFGAVLASIETPSAMKSIATSSASKEDGEYAQIVRAVERLPTKTVSYARAACLVADGRDIDASALRCVIPMLRGDIAIVDGKGSALASAHRDGNKIAEEWEVELDEGGNLRIKPIDGFELAFEVNGKPVSSAWLFKTAFNRALLTEDVLSFAQPLSSAARQPVRVGYVMGLAHSIQGVTRRGKKVGDLSEIAGWELGE